jgi:hypothetical protein
MGNLRRGFMRLGVILPALWFVFWTFAYVIHSQVAENVAAAPAWSPATRIALGTAAVLALPWVISGFRPN